MTNKKTSGEALANASPHVDKTEEGTDADQFAPHEPAERNRSRHRSWVYLMLILAGFVAGAGGIGYLGWSQLEALKGEFSGVSQSMQAHVTQLEASQEASRKSLLKDVDNRTVEVESRLQGFDDNVNSLSNLVAQTTQSDRDGLVIAEVDYLLQLANYRIELEHNRDGALLAVSRAQSRLGSLGASVYASILDQIATDKADLEQVVVPKVSAIVDTLSAMLARVDDLGTGSKKIAPQGESPSADERKEGGWNAFVSAFGENLSQFVEIDRAGGAVAPTLIPNQEHFARENVRLSLKSARACAIRRDTENFHLALTEAGLWLDSQFGSSSETRYMEGELERLSQVDLIPVYPMFDDSLALVRKLSQMTTVSQEPGENISSEVNAQTIDETTPGASVVPTTVRASDRVKEVLQFVAEESGGKDPLAQDGDNAGALVEGASQ